MPRKKVSPALALARTKVWKRINSFFPHFVGDNVLRKAKGRYLEALALKHLHSFAVQETRGVTEYMVRKWLVEDEAFMECCNVMRLAFIDNLEYRALCKAGVYGPKSQVKHRHINVADLCQFIRIARYNGVYRRLKGTGNAGEAGPAGVVSRDGEGRSCVQIEDGREGDLHAIPAAVPVPPKS